MAEKANFDLLPSSLSGDVELPTALIVSVSRQIVGKRDFIFSVNLRQSFLGW
jgi:hypothetical protein